MKRVFVGMSSVLLPRSIVKWTGPHYDRLWIQWYLWQFNDVQDHKVQHRAMACSGCVALFIAVGGTFAVHVCRAPGKPVAILLWPPSLAEISSGPVGHVFLEALLPRP